MSLEYVIFCNACGRHIDASTKPAAEARRAIRETGGRVNLRGAKDLCPECVTDGRQP